MLPARRPLIPCPPRPPGRPSSSSITVKSLARVHRCALCIDGVSEAKARYLPTNPTRGSALSLNGDYKATKRSERYSAPVCLLPPLIHRALPAIECTSSFPASSPHGLPLVRSSPAPTPPFPPSLNAAKARGLGFPDGGRRRNGLEPSAKSSQQPGGGDGMGGRAAPLSRPPPPRLPRDAPPRLAQ